MHRRFLVRLLLLLAPIALLSACATDPSVATPDFDVTLEDASDSLGVFGVGFLLVNPTLTPIATSSAAGSSVVASSLSPAADEVVEIGDGLYVGNLVLGEDGATVGFKLPSEPVIPGPVLAPVESAFFNATNAPDCAVSAAPASANVTYVAAQGFLFPGIFLFGIDGIEISIASEAAVDLGTFPTEGQAILNWVYSDTDVVVDFVGPDCDGYVVDSLALDTGWNTLQWTFANVGTPSETLTVTAIEQPDSVIVTTGAP